MILFNNETMILGTNSQARSKNISQLEAASPRKTGNNSSRNHHFSIYTRKSPLVSLNKKREFIDPIDLINALNDKSVEAIDKN